MNRVYKGAVPRKVQKAFAERLRQVRLKGDINTPEYAHVMELRAKGEITEDIARTAFRKRKIPNKTLTPEQGLLNRAKWWREHGLEMSPRYQHTMRLYHQGRLKDVESALPKVRGFNIKRERLNALIENNKEYIYKGASVGTRADELLFDDMIDSNRDMFAASNVDKYIKLFELYERSKNKLVDEYDKLS